MIADFLPAAFVQYLHWLQNRLRYRDVSISQWATVTRTSKLARHVAVHDHARVVASEVGNYTYVAEHARLICCEVGKFCSIGPFSMVGGGVHPARDWVSTSPVFFSTARQCGVSFVDDNRFEELPLTIVGHDVWIGHGASILPGTRVGSGAIIGAGAVVTNDVPPYTVVGGVPARTIRSRFAPEEIAQLVRIEWWNQSEEWLRRNAGYFRSIGHFLGHMADAANQTSTAAL